MVKSTRLLSEGHVSGTRVRIPLSPPVFAQASRLCFVAAKQRSRMARPVYIKARYPMKFWQEEVNRFSVLK